MQYKRKRYEKISVRNIFSQGEITKEKGGAVMEVYHLISNPAAGKDKAKKSLDRVKQVFIDAGKQVETHVSACQGDATRIARGLTENGAMNIIAHGGDGTLHEVLNGLHDPSKCNLGLIPAGTGNDFAEKLGIPTDVEKAAQLILQTQAQPIDFLQVDNVRCMNVGGIGMDVDVLERCKTGRFKGKIKYVMSLIKSLFAFKGCKVRVESEGVTEERDVLLAAFCNGSYFGGGIKICPPADVADGKLNAMLIDCIGGKWKIIKAFITLMKGKVMEYPDKLYFLCDKLQILPQKPCAAQLDGEIYKGLNLCVSVKQGLKFYR